MRKEQKFPAWVTSVYASSIFTLARALKLRENHGLKRDMEQLVQDLKLFYHNVHIVRRMRRISNPLPISLPKRVAI